MNTQSPQKKAIIIIVIIFLFLFLTVFRILPFPILIFAIIIGINLYNQAKKNTADPARDALAAAGAKYEKKMYDAFGVEDDADEEIGDDEFTDDEVIDNDESMAAAPQENYIPLRNDCAVQPTQNPEFCHNEHYTKAMSAADKKAELAELDSLLLQGFMEKDEYNEKRREIMRG